ncbi:MAG: hypothetical protein CMC08_08730 [Flavobacteriaceae bacterium]|nr:hypothetical protein [Flavobacteriaceae bacterium]
MKNLLLFTALLCSPAVLLAQLFVKPNGATDSYVYVNDQVIFVEQDLNLEKNNAPGTTVPSIYLRNKAQLIQGDTGSSNDGNGHLSVYQTVDSTSAYHYTFFHSPVGNPNGAAGNRGSGLPRLFDCDGCGDTQTASSQLARTSGLNGNSSTSPGTISTRWAYTKPPSPNNDAEANWSRLNGSENADPGLGFIMKGLSPGGGATTQAYTFDFRGRANNGVISINMPANMYRVVSGNPYPSAIDLVPFITENTIISAIRFWDEPKDSEFSHYYSDKSGGWGTWTAVGGAMGTYVPPAFTNYDAGGFTSGGTGKGKMVNRRFVPIAQGFEILTDGTAGTIEFKNSHRVYVPKDDVISVFRNSENTASEEEAASAAANVDDRWPQMRLDIVFNELYARQILLGFHDTATDKDDRMYDGPSPMDAKAGEAYFTIDSDEGIKPYVINFTNFELGKRIPLGFKLTKQSTLDFKVIEEVKIDHKAYLWDSQTNISQQINGNGEASLTLPAGTYHNRFYIVFRGTTEPKLPPVAAITPTRTRENLKENMDFFQNNRLGILEVSNPEGYMIKSASIFDMSGKLVYSENSVGNGNSFSFPTANLSDGVYLVKLITDQDQQIDYKASVFNKR